MSYQSLIVRELIESLGRSPEEVAGKLMKAGVHGRRGKSNSCPVANYVKSQVTDREFGISQTGWKLNGPSLFDLLEDQGSSPNPVARFIREFYDGLYPALESS